MPERGPANHNWRGGRVVDPRGYVLLRLPDHPNADVRGYVYEHIVIMTEHLGRALVSPEEVHHDNEVPGDNRIENLLLCANKREHKHAHGHGVGPCRKCGSEDWYVRRDNRCRQCRECRRARRAAGRP